MSELEKAVSEMLVKATSAAEAAGRFAVEQLPDIAQQYVTYIAIYSWLFVVLGTLISVIPFIAAFRLTRDFGDIDRTGTLIITGLISNTIGWIMVGGNLQNAILATWAPKILLIQWAATLVR